MTRLCQLVVPDVSGQVDGVHVKARHGVNYFTPAKNVPSPLLICHNNG